MSRMSEPSGAGGPDGTPAAGHPVRIPGDTRLYVPAHPRPPAGPAQEAAVGLALQTVPATGELVAVAFTTLDALVAALGECQPWITLPAGRLAELVSRGGLARMSINPVRPGPHARPRPAGHSARPPR